MTLYRGRVGTLSSTAEDPAAQNRLAEVLFVGPSGTLAAGQIRVLVMEVDRQWETVVREGSLLPLSDAQQQLRDKHGLPHKFARACWRACRNLEITNQEAQAAIYEYTQEFMNARNPK